MKAKKILFVNQEMTPYVPESGLSLLGRKLPQLTQENSREIRTFMPKWSIIKERRNQLHEVIRLSGMNLEVDDTDHPLIIKVASIQAARLQIYFIDNDEFFQKHLMSYDENGMPYSTNPERACFYARGVLETLKKLRWAPDIIHCQGWMSAFIPLFVKGEYANDPSYRNCMTVFTPSHTRMNAPLPDNINGILTFETPSLPQIVQGIDEPADMQLLNRMGVKWADGVAAYEKNDCLMQLAKQLGKPYTEADGAEELMTLFPAFYDTVWSTKEHED